MAVDGIVSAGTKVAAKALPKSIVKAMGKFGAKVGIQAVDIRAGASLRWMQVWDTLFAVEVSMIDWTEWIMPLVLGGIVFVLGTLPSRAVAIARPPSRLRRALPIYVPIFTIGQGYITVIVHSLVAETSLDEWMITIVIVASLAWLAILAVIGISLNRGRDRSEKA